MKPLLRLVEEIRHGIPSHYHVDLENRLAIAWGERKRKRFDIKPRSRGENLVATRENRARIIYLQAQDEDCLLFLAFILAYSPRSCVDFKTTEFVEFHDYALDNIQQRASPETEKLLKTMAIRRGFNQNLHYLNYMQTMFPEGFRELEPICETLVSTAAESVGNEMRIDEIGQDDRGRQIERMYSNGPISQVSLKEVRRINNKLLDYNDTPGPERRYFHHDMAWP
ncbi:hypothetical protein V496_00569 [Pseudogymnoascus sp. VKM F-4515 (FW-2607)]|nr:hypothetical protein V496_00569 [Pseudogymnoascus sp. VKM F-4515 (FW-2607)]